MPKISALPELSTAVQPGFEIPVHNTESGDTEKMTLGEMTGYPQLGWIAAVETWAYASWSATTRIGVITVPAGALLKYNVGYRVYLSQATGGVKMGIIQAVSDTTLTVFFPSGTTFNNEAITDPMYSPVKVPFGFDPDPNLWSITATFVNDRSTASTVWASLSESMVIGIGAWYVWHNQSLIVDAAATSQRILRVTLSNTTNSEAYPELTVMQNHDGETTATSAHASSASASAYIKVAAQTTLTLLGMLPNAANLSNAGVWNGTNMNGKVRATNAYL